MASGLEIAARDLTLVFCESPPIFASANFVISSFFLMKHQEKGTGRCDLVGKALNEAVSDVNTPLDGCAYPG